jgi:hypothetical protein
VVQVVLGMATTLKQDKAGLLDFIQGKAQATAA